MAMYLSYHSYLIIERATGLILTPCIKAQISNHQGLLGAFKPRCTKEGQFEKKQCHRSTGFCWCVNPETGKEISGTRKRGEVICGK